MLFQELIQILQQTYEIQLIASGNCSNIMGVHFLDRNEHHWDEHVLYVGSFAESKTQPNRPIMLLSLEEHPVLPEGSSYAHICQEDLYDLYNTAKTLVVEDLRGESVFFELAQMALNEKSIDYIINKAAALLENALILVDSGQKVLTHSSNYKIVDPLWAQNIQRGYCSYEFIQKVRSSRDMKKWNKHGSETKFITLPGDSQPKLVARITYEGHVTGAVIMIEHHAPIRPFHQRLLPLIGRLLFDVINSSSASSGIFRSHYSTILYNLLDDAEILNTLEYIAISKIDFPSEMRAVVARFVQPKQNRYLKYTFSLELERIFPKRYSVIYKSYIGILVQSVSEKQRKELAALAKNEDVTIGISWPFTDIMEFKRYFYQAVISIKLAYCFGQLNQVIDYDDYSYYDLLYNYKGRVPLQQYCHPALQILRDYDKANNTELYVTLRTYLECGKNQRATAEALFIHRNSLIYRINRIKQLTGLELDNINVTYSLIDSFRIETFLNSI